MKTRLTLIACILFTGHLMFAQSNDADKLEIAVGGSFAKPKIIPKMSKLAVAQITVDYKLTTTVKTIGKEKSTGAMAGAKVTAFLETTDGELTENDFQEVTDAFYSSFQKKLKENGVDTVAWTSIEATEFYKNGTEKDKDKDKESSKGEKGGNVWVTSTAHKGNVLYGGGIAFAFGKIKKASAFCEQLGAPAGFFNLTVDFADVLVNVDIKTGSGSYYIPKTRTFKYNASVNAEMKVITTGQTGATLFWNEKSQGETLWIRGDIDAGLPYHDTINQDDSRLQKNFASLWQFRKEMNPVVIQTTKAKYKAAALKALEKYADALIAKSKEAKK